LGQGRDVMDDSETDDLLGRPPDRQAGIANRVA
jgi:hypothetical protein